MKNTSILTIIILLIATATTTGAQVLSADTLAFPAPLATAAGHIRFTPIPEATTTTISGSKAEINLGPIQIKNARTWATVAGFTGIAVGAYFGGYAEMKSRYFGTKRNWDSFHITRDAGLICTSLGSASLGASITIGEKPRLLPVIWRLCAGAVLYRITAEATYNLTKPR